MPFTLKPEYNDADRNPRHTRIREIFETREPDSLLGFSEYLREQTDVYAKDELLQYEINGIKADVRVALKFLDDAGLPVAGPTAQKTKSGKRIWANRELFSYDDYCLTFTEYMGRSEANSDMAEKYADECKERYGKRPKRMKL